MAVQSFSYDITLLLTKYAGRWANFVKNNSKKFWETFSWYRHIICHYESTTNPQFEIFSPVQSSDIALSKILHAAVALKIVSS